MALARLTTRPRLTPLRETLGEHEHEQPPCTYLVDGLDQLAYLLPSWQRSLRAERRSPRAISNYLGSAQKFGSFLADHEMPTRVGSISREHVQEFLITAELNGRPRPTLGWRSPSQALDEALQ
jgi:hypothetical protein